MIFILTGKETITGNPKMLAVLMNGVSVSARDL